MAALLGLSLIVSGCDGVVDPDAVQPPEIVQVAVGAYHVCALTDDGRAYCWGMSQTGALGGEHVDETRAAPAASADGLRFRFISAGSGRTCGITHDAEAYCWGAAPTGDPGVVSAAPVLVPGGHRWAAVGVGNSHTCGRTTDGRVFCWGGNASGELGNGATAGSSVPVEVHGGRTYTRLTVGSAHACAVAPDGAAYCWGSNRQGEVGTHAEMETCYFMHREPIPYACSRIPRRVEADFAMTEVSAGSASTCGLTSSGEAHCWGAPPHSREIVRLPEPVPGAPPLEAVSAGGSHICGTTSAGAAHCIGTNVHGQLGNGSWTDGGAGDSVVRTMVGVTGEYAFSAVTAGEGITCGVAEGRVFCWGNAVFGKLGTGAPAPDSCMYGVACSTRPVRTVEPWRD